MAYNKIILGGNQIIDYIYIQKGLPEGFNSVDSEPDSWNDDTILFADFDDSEKPLAAGNSELIGSIDNYEIRRKEYNGNYSEYVGTIKAKSDDEKTPPKKFLIDYSVKNNMDYIYYLYPNVDTTKSGTILSAVATKPLSIDCPYWSLFIVDESGEDNVYYLDKMFKFELNLQVDDMNNNAQISITNNFTKYPTVQIGSSNYWTGSLSALCGFISSNDVDYVQTPNMVNEIKSITSDTRKKFLKDIEGNIFEVNVAAPISISSDNTTAKEIKTLRFSWVEVGSAEGVSIIDNPNKETYGWVITETGEAMPYMSYVWGDQYIWDNSYYWTAHEGLDKIKASNMGRSLKEGDDK